MKLAKNLGTFLLAVWLIMYGLIAMFGLNFRGSSMVMALLALAAGILILLDR
jgi:hypothetical protein